MKTLKIWTSLYSIPSMFKAIARVLHLFSALEAIHKL
jgi:hypothetical protein